MAELFDKSRLIGTSATFLGLISEVERLARLDVSALLLGETGAGKTTLAEYMHSISPRSGGAFCELNCATIPKDLIESELFGHEKGAFTDAKERKIGLFEQADGGTLFLDEIGEMSPELQAKLLRVIETKQIKRLGGQRMIRCDVRLIYATNCDLSRLRDDLVYRMDEARINVPPLRERVEDIPALVQHYLDEARKKCEQGALGRADPFVLDDAALRVLCGHKWPGNVRELRNVVLKIALLTLDKPLITAPDVGAVLRRRAADNAPGPEVIAVEDAVVEGDGLLRSVPFVYQPGDEPIDLYFARVLVSVYDALMREHNNHTRVSNMLGIERVSLYARLKLARGIVGNAQAQKPAA